MTGEASQSDGNDAVTWADSGVGEAGPIQLALQLPAVVSVRHGCKVTRMLPAIRANVQEAQGSMDQLATAAFTSVCGVMYHNPPEAPAHVPRLAPPQLHENSEPVHTHIVSLACPHVADYGSHHASQMSAKPRRQAKDCGVSVTQLCDSLRQKIAGNNADRVLPEQVGNIQPAQDTPTHPALT